MPLKGSPFPPGRDILANFAWIDLVTATGFVVFDGINAEDSGGNNYILNTSTNSTLMTPTKENDGAYPTSLVTLAINGLDLDFDSSIFQLPRTIEGTALVRISSAFHVSTASNSVITVRIRKWDGSSEVTLGSESTITEELTSGEEFGHVLQIPISRTLFKKGDTLRLTVEVATSGTFQLAHNPRDTAIRNFSAGNSRLSIALPFKLDFL